MYKNTLIGFIGQGFVGKNYADDFEARGHNIVRYDLGAYKDNLSKIQDCSLVFVAVPTPTTPQGFDDSALYDALKIIKANSTVVIKSTIRVGTTRKLQNDFPHLTIMHSPEFLREKHAAEDVKNPTRNIIGITDMDNTELKKLAQEVLKVLAPAPYELITTCENAEMIKYGGNCFLYIKVVFMNMLYDLIKKYDLDYEVIKEAMAQDQRIGPSHMNILDQSGRGAGGHCFIKDFEVFIQMLQSEELKEQANAATGIRNLNLQYLKNSKKDLDLLKKIYG